MRCGFYLLLSLLYYYPASPMLLVAIWVAPLANVQALYFDLHHCVSGLNGFLDPCDQSQYENI